ncbi:unnamed protein product [Clonostachys byssicola]|uniref:Uncharacterized protein n=1 Tax=Clonostachys byssicola TaxID=160290 RepID=A0A9N9Y4L7_9HYPO|nr:unnamed protein product [Clonostachys byssicola]
MLETISIQPLPGRRLRPQKLGLLHVPREVQLLMYEFALIECPKWEKGHKPGCRYKPNDIHCTEIPPFLNLSINIWQTLEGEFKQNIGNHCNCAKRDGLGLLGVNREIHNLAAPIFWSQNTFCFLDAMEFLATVGHRLRDECRNHLRSISILNPDATGFSNHVSLPYSLSRSKANMQAFWSTVRKCKQLAKLELPPPYIKPALFSIDQWGLLAEHLTELRTVRFSYLLPYTNVDCGWGRPSHFRYFNPSCRYPGQQDVFVRCSRTVPLRQEDWTSEAATEFYREMELNFKIHVDTIVKTKFLNADPERLANYQNTFKLLPSLDEHHRTHRITLPIGEKTAIKFYGLPISKKTRIQQARKRQALDRTQRLKNGLTQSQFEEQQERKNQLKEQEERKEMRERDDALVERRMRRIQIHDAEAATVKKQKKKVRKEDAKRKEQRKLERKRAS